MAVETGTINDGIVEKAHRTIPILMVLGSAGVCEAWRARSESTSPALRCSLRARSVVRAQRESSGVVSRGSSGEGSQSVVVVQRISIRRGRSSAALGTRTVSTPSSSWAETPSAFTSPGSTTS